MDIYAGKKDAVSSIHQPVFEFKSPFSANTCGGGWVETEKWRT
jgi:hypothetical protein